jgi:hypothetical protein
MAAMAAQPLQAWRKRPLAYAQSQIVSPSEFISDHVPKQQRQECHGADAANDDDTRHNGEAYVH